MRRKYTLKKILKTIWITAGVLFTFWMFYSYESHGVDESLFQSNNLVKVENTDDYFLFTPEKEFKNVVVFYPGAMVETEAYVPLCRKIADNGIQVYLIKMPWRLATKGYNRPKELHLFDDAAKNYILAGIHRAEKWQHNLYMKTPN